MEQIFALVQSDSSDNVVIGSDFNYIYIHITYTYTNVNVCVMRTAFELQIIFEYETLRMKINARCIISLNYRMLKSGKRVFRDIALGVFLSSQQ